MKGCLTYLLATLGAIAFCLAVAVVVGLVTEGPPIIAAITGGVLVLVFVSGRRQRR